MVLTRRAYKSIVRWLPNELISEIMAHSSRLDLVALCRTSRLINGLAIPLLYRAIYLSETRDMEVFVSTVEKYADSPSPLSQYVREFLITVVDDPSLYPGVINRITAVLCDFHNLHTLQLFALATHFADLLRNAQFPSLRTFRYAVSPDISSILPAFVNRHRTITTLDFIEVPDGRKFRLDPIQLPNLIKYSGISFCVPSFSCQNKTVQFICLHWHSDDRDPEAILGQLGQMMCTAGTTGLIINADEIHKPTFLESIARNVSGIHFLIFQKYQRSAPGRRISAPDSIEILTPLKKLKELVMLEFHDFDDTLDHTEGDRQIDSNFLLMWGSVCQSLCLVVLHGHQWERTETGWEIDYTVTPSPRSHTYSI
ncbi:hypothetical protein B0H19DRAFT_1188084 [Mycena capillaripes]|nr:hypothetical protein B0H19DRAFT_1188084 [Mycena capillaripes]